MKISKIMKKTLFRIGLILSLLAFFLSVLSFHGLGKYGLVQAEEDCIKISCSSGNDNYFSCIQGKQQCWQQKIDETKSQAITLTNTINLFNGQISLQQLQVDQTLAEINQLEKEVTDLVGRIKGLGYSLDRLSAVLIERVRTQYKQSRSATPVLNLLAANTLSELITRSKYLLLAQKQTVDAMTKTETQRLEYDDQKQLKQQKQLELEVKKKKLLVQEKELLRKKADQQYLLQETQNNEAEYQAQLAQTLAESRAIRSIIAGGGIEKKMGEVNEGDRIAGIVVGRSPCSTGTHLHFEIVKDGAHFNPTLYLSSISALSASGSWRWPLDNAAIITQEYGLTQYARTGRYGRDINGNPLPHTGIDMVSKTSGDYDVRAVRKGTLYVGSYPGICPAPYNGPLLYVKVDHADSNISSYYLHAI